MFANRHAIYRGLIAIGRFEQGPDTLPYSTPLVASVLSAYALVKMGIAFLTVPPVVAFISGLVYTLLSVTIVAAALTFRRFPNRIVQTLTAFARIGTVVNLVAFLGDVFRQVVSSPSAGHLRNARVYIPTYGLELGHQRPHIEARALDPVSAGIRVSFAHYRS